MTFLIGYVSLLVVFGAVDALWLTTMGPVLYRPALGDILLPQVRLAPAIAFYLIYPVGLLIFAVLPALKVGSLSNAMFLGLLFGAIAYATYDLTNFATLRNWTIHITVLDIAYGAVVSGVAAAASAWLLRLVSH